MENAELKTLLKKMIESSLTKDETKQLNKLVMNMDNMMLEEELYSVWETYSAKGRRNQTAFETVKSNIKQIVRPAKQIPIRKYLFRIAAILMLPVMGLGIYFMAKNAAIQELTKNEYSIVTSKGERTSVILPDGTKVIIAANSVFKYPATFGNKARTVNLSGEAFFEVTHNEKLPFVVKAGEINVEVLGTKFNLSAYPDEKFAEAALLEGSVKAYRTSNPDEVVYLAPNQKVKFDFQNNLISKLETDLYVETAWLENRLVFQSDSILNILKRLECFYGVEFTIHGEMPADLFTASYNEEDINQILRNLQQHYSFSYKKTGNKLNLNFK